MVVTIKEMRVKASFSGCRSSHRRQEMECWKVPMSETWLKYCLTVFQPQIKKIQEASPSLYSISIRKLTNIYSMIHGLNMSTKTMNDNSWLKRCCRIHSAKKNESLSYCIVVIVWYEHSVKSSCLMSHILQVPP